MDLVTYWSGEDFVGWHADEKQGEVLILSIVTDSQNGTRPIFIKPKTNSMLPLQEGDEEIIIFVGQGDAYEMDGEFFHLFVSLCHHFLFCSMISLWWWWW